MPQSSHSDFIVVDCQKAPNGKENSHVCVPRSWIRCEMGGKRVAIVYPCEDEARTAARVRNQEAPDDAWTYYIGDIKCETNSYEYGSTIVQTVLLYNEYLRDTNQTTNQKRKEKKTKKQPLPEQKDSLKVRIKLPKASLEKRKKKSKSKSNISKSPNYEIITEPTAHIDREPVSENILNREDNISTQSDGPHITTESSIPTSIANKSTAQTPKTPIEFKIDEMIQSYLPETTLKHIPINTPSSKNAENLDMDIDNESIATNLSFPKLTPEEREFIINLETEQKNTIFNIRILVLFVKNLYIKVHENKKTLDQIISKYGPSITVTAPQRQPEPSKNPEETPQDVEMATETDTPVTSTETLEEVESPLPTSTTAEPVTDKGKEAKKEKINWILRHPDPGKGLVELGKHTGIYVSADGLNKCKENCNSVESFAKSLLPEVFTKDRNTEIKGKIMRPPMYFPAKIALVNYAMEYGQQVGWQDMEFEMILNSLRDVLHDDLDFPTGSAHNDDQCCMCVKQCCVTVH
uniref:BEN domain-containing protein n=1 Tax=Heliothis virescens TaxID=7102 RepID=A0A2A4IT30_HELVI